MYAMYACEACVAHRSSLIENGGTAAAMMHSA
jgi:hypothetical protein